MPFDYFMVAVGGALGAMARFWFAAFMVRLTGPAFPWGTLMINVFGSFVIGVFASWTHPGSIIQMTHHMALFTMIGICGGFTTFSSFSLQTLDLVRGKQALRGLAYVILSVALCLVAVWLGTKL